MTTLAVPHSDLAGIDLGNLDLWQDGPPHELFACLRDTPGLHYSALEAFPEERGFWSVARYEDIATVGRDHATYSSNRSIILVDKLSWDGETPDPIDLSANMLITQDPPRHDRLKALVQRALLPNALETHLTNARNHQPRL